MLRWRRLEERSGLRIIKASVFIKLILIYSLDTGEVTELLGTGVRDFKERPRLRIENEIIYIYIHMFFKNIKQLRLKRIMDKARIGLKAESKLVPRFRGEVQQEPLR